MSPDAFIAWAGSAARKFRTVERDSNDSDLAPFRDLVGRASVVALGEPGHGAHQPLALRNRLFTYLVEHCGFTAIALETSFSESRAVHDFVAGGPGNAADVARRSLTWGFGEYAENAELIQWMRDYNGRAAGRRKINFYGIDLSGADNDGAFPNAQIALQQVVQYLRAAAPDASKDLLAEIAPVLRRVSAAGYARVAASRDRALDGALESLHGFLRDHAALLRRGGKESEYEWALRGVIVAGQLRDILRLGDEPKTGGAMPASEYRKVNVRDAAMADNVLWVRAQEGKKGRILVFAHDAHVMNASTRGGIWSVFSEAPRMMGQHLRAALGGNLIIIGTLGAHNGAGLPAGPPIGGSVDAALDTLGLPLFVLDLRAAAREPDALRWLDAPHPVRANFNTELDVGLREAFDALVFIDRLTAARKMGDVPAR
jgi:erythromycin esterase